MMATGLDVYKAIQSWCVLVLAGTGASVIQAFQNAPQTALPQIAISSPTATPFGRSSSVSSYTQDTQDPTKYNGTISIDYEGTVSLWETGGDGALLRAIVNSLDSQEAIAHFSARGVVVDFPQSQQIIFLPRLQEGAWLKESTTVLSVRWRETFDTSTGKINQNVYSGEVQGSLNEPHEITFDI